MGSQAINRKTQKKGCFRPARTLYWKAVKMTERKVPEDIESLRQTWYSLFLKWNKIHYTLGIFTIVAGITTASRPAVISNIPAVMDLLAWLAAVGIALVFFLAPAKRASGYIDAWRHLTENVKRYQLSETFPAEHLVEAVKLGEQMIRSAETWR